MPSTSDPAGETTRADAGARLERLPPVSPGRFDEVRHSDGTLRDHWRRFASTAGDLRPEALAHASARIARQMHEHGVTYNVYESADGPVRPWALDVLPLIVTSVDWMALDAGLCRYATLLNALAADLYGARQLIAERIIPPTVIFGHRGFVRSAVGARPASGTFVHVAAFDLARDPEGRWRAIGARLQAPSGLGYALENRATLARIFPEALRELDVRPLDSCAEILRDTLTSDAPTEDDARAVILTPGPYNETYFEHLYLARQLGLTLVQGGDLTVRQNRVFLKTVAGLRPVHAIWRRVDDDFSDPLELRSDSALGVAGLMQAWRTGHVLVANAFGLGVLESPALVPYLPAVARRLLGGDLDLPVLPPTPAHVPTPSRAAQGAIGRLDDTGGRATWMNRLSVDPSDYAVHATVPLSQGPVSSDGVLAHRGVMVRAFVVSDGRGGYRLLPAALTRVATDDRLSVSAQRGGASKDTWVLGAGTEPARAHDQRDLSPAHAERRLVTSRAAEHLFWLGRYAERSENAARLTRTILARLIEGSVLPRPLIACMVRRSAEEGLLNEQDLSRGKGERGEYPLRHLITALTEGVFDRSKRSGLNFGVDHATRAAAAIRERLSYDNWRLLAQLARRLTPRFSQTVDVDGALEAVDDAILSLVAAGGLEMAHMTRDDGWRFLSLGRHLERLAFMSATLLNVPASHGTDEPAVLDWILDLSDSLITYRTRYQRAPEWAAVVDLLLFDGRNPRSVLFQVGKLARHVQLLPGDALGDLGGEIETLERMQRSDEEDLRDVVPVPPAGGTTALLARCHDLAERLSDALTLQYFSHVYDAQHATMNA